MTSVKQIDNDGTVSYTKTITVWGRQVEAAYFPEYDETFLTPVNDDGYFRKGNCFANYLRKLDDSGFLVVRASYESISLAGDDFSLNTDFVADTALNLFA